MSNAEPSRAGQSGEEQIRGEEKKIDAVQVQCSPVNNGAGRKETGCSSSNAQRLYSWMTNKEMKERKKERFERHEVMTVHFQIISKANVKGKKRATITFNFLTPERKTKSKRNCM